MTQTPAAADLAVHARWVIPVEGSERVLEHHAVIVRDGQIADVLPSEQASARWRAAETVELDRHALMPGLVNAHTHAAMSLFRGLADDLPLMSWLEEHIWPAEGKWMSEPFVADGTRLAATEMIRGGTTCFGDMYFFPDTIARVVQESGIRAAIFTGILDFPTPMGNGPEDYLRAAVNASDAWRHEPRITIGFGPHAPYTVSDAPLEKVRTYAEELDAPIMMHVHETAEEVQQAVAATGERPLERLHRLGLLSPRFMAVHMTDLSAAEMELARATGIHVAHCPESNMKLGNGFCRVEQLRHAGVDLGLGTDGAASNNDLDMMGEMRTAALLGKAVAHDPSALPAEAVLEMATLGGARSLGLEQQIGSLVPGKQADLVAVDLGQTETQPLYDPLAQIIYSATRSQVSHTWVAGQCLLRERELTLINAERLQQDVTRWNHRIAEDGDD